MDAYFINSRNIIPLLAEFPLYDIDHIALDAFYNLVLGGSEKTGKES